MPLGAWRWRARGPARRRTFVLSAVAACLVGLLVGTVALVWGAPPLGNVTPNTVYATEVSYASATQAWGAAEWTSAPTTLGGPGWTTIAVLTPGQANEADKWSVSALAADFTGGASQKNVIDCALAALTASDPDGGLYVAPSGGTAAWSTSSTALTCLAPTVVLGCGPYGAAGCAGYSADLSSNPVSLQYQALVSDGGVLLQGAFASDAGPDAAAYPAYRVNATLAELRRSFLPFAAPTPTPAGVIPDAGALLVFDTPPYFVLPSGQSAIITVVAIGDSLVGGWQSGGVGNSQQFQSWPEQMAFLLGSGATLPVNLGIGGVPCTTTLADVPLAASYGVPGTLWVLDYLCGTNDVIGIDAGNNVGVTLITGRWQAIAQAALSDGFNVALLDTIPANVFFDPNASPLDYTGVPYYVLLDAGANYPGNAWSYYLNVSNTEALGVVSDGGPSAGNQCLLPPVVCDSYGSGCYCVDEQIHQSPNKDLVSGNVNALAVVQAAGRAIGQPWDAGAPSPVVPALLPLDPSPVYLPGNQLYEEDHDLTLDGDDLTASPSGPNGTFFSSLYNYQRYYTGLNIFWGTGSVFPGVDSGVPGYGEPGVLNLSVAGDTCAALTSSFAARVTAQLGTSGGAPVPPHRTRLLATCGTADGLSAESEPTACSDALAYVSAAHTDGWTVDFAGIPDNPGFPTTGSGGWAEAFNACVAAGIGSTGTFLDFGAGSADTETGALVGSVNRPYFFSDGDGGLLSWNGSAHWAYEAVLSIKNAGGP